MIAMIAAAAMTTTTMITDAAMIAAAGIFRLALGERASPTLSAQATLPLPGMFRA